MLTTPMIRSIHCNNNRNARANPGRLWQNDILEKLESIQHDKKDYNAMIPE